MRRRFVIEYVVFILSRRIKGFKIFIVIKYSLGRVVIIGFY